MAPVSGLKTFSGIMDFSFRPSVSIMAKSVVRLGLDIHDFRVPLTRSVQQVMVQSITQNFDAEGRPSWEPLSEDTIMARELSGFSDGPILDRTGALKAAATSPDIWTITNQSATVRNLPSSVWYGVVQQEGLTGEAGPTGKDLLKTLHKRSFIGSGLTAGDFAMALGGHASGDIPARPFIMFQDQDFDAIERIFGKWLDERILARWVGFGLTL